MGSFFKDKDKGMVDLIKRVAQAKGSYVKIGWFESEQSKNIRKESANGRGAKAKNFDIALWNEFGTTRNGKEHIPARPFIRSSYDENIHRVNALLKREFGRIIDGDTTAGKSLGKIGLFVESYTKRKIVTLKEPPNSEETVKRKQSDNPLVDTKQLGNSIVSKVTINNTGLVR